MCSSGSPPESYENQQKYAEMIEWMEDDWEARFKPVEEMLLGELENRDTNTRENVSAAQEAAKTSYDATLGMSERNMQMYGTELDADQQAAADRSAEITGQGTQIAAGNLARDASTARYDQLEQNMVSLGRGVQGAAISGMGSAAGLEANRNATNQSIYAQNKANAWGAAGSVASMAAMAMMMSDKNAKTNIKKASTKTALKDIESIVLKKYDYKPGMSLGREEKGHIGGMAQDMPDSMTTADKKRVDIGDSVMSLVGGMQEISKRLGKLEQRHGR